MNARRRVSRAGMREYPGRLYHHTPGWVRSGTLFHVRLRSNPASARELTSHHGPALLAAVQRYHDLGHWWCALFLLMPDHAHAILAFPPSPGMSTTVMNFKRATARLLNVRWQGGYFDHRLRTTRDVRETWDYIRRNPVVKGLCSAEDQWPWWWSNS